MNPKIKRILIAAVLVILVLVYTYPGMIGKVVDAETGEPIEGAVIMAEWTTTEGLPGLTSTKSYKVVEVLTGRSGWTWISGAYKPSAKLGSLAVYKKGYVAWSKDTIFPDYNKRADFHWCCFYKVFKLEKFKSDYSYNDHTSFIRSAISAGFTDNKKRSINDAYEWEKQKALEERKKTWNK
jgi:hypothetical protein